MGQSIAPGGTGDVELDPARLESEETLKVYTKGLPPGNRVATLQDELVALATPPVITGAAEISRTRSQLVERLRADTFNHFPRPPPALAIEEEFALDAGAGARFAFTSEEGWRLHGVRRSPPDLQGPAPVVVVLRSPGEARNESERFARQLKASWATVIVETRGTGNTSWGEDLNWHVRRASAWIGRTIASMRVWDALRAPEAARLLPDVDAGQVSIAARGEMGAVALYAALLDGRVRTVFLESPPATQNAPGQPDGRGPATEMLGCLRYTDLRQVAGLLYPAEIVMSGTVPSSYKWREDLYRKLGPPRPVFRVRRRSRSGVRHKRRQRLAGLEGGGTDVPARLCGRGGESTHYPADRHWG